MGMTITEKILAKASGKKMVLPGDIVWTKIDVAMLLHDAPPATLPAFRRLAKNVWDPGKIVSIIEHLIPAHNIWSAETQKQLREFTKEQSISNFIDMGRSGICHNTMVEEGHVRPSEVVVGVDSDTPTLGALGCFAVGIGFTEMGAVLATGEDWFRVPESIRISARGNLHDYVIGKDVALYVLGQVGPYGELYKAVEFVGSTIRQMSMDSRLSLINGATDGMNAKNGIIGPDEKTIEYLKSVTDRSFITLSSDPDSEYADTYDFDVSKLEPQVAEPPRPANAKPVSEVSGIPVDQVYIGSCANGRIEDMRLAARILKGRNVHQSVRLLVMPASQRIYAQALAEGLLEIFVKAGAIVLPPSCSVCVGVNAVLAEGETCVSTTNKNYRGRMGHPDSKIYLANPATAAASAIEGQICDPREV